MYVNVITGYLLICFTIEHLWQSGEALLICFAAFSGFDVETQKML